MVIVFQALSVGNTTACRSPRFGVWKSLRAVHCPNHPNNPTLLLYTHAPKETGCLMPVPSGGQRGFPIHRDIFRQENRVWKNSFAQASTQQDTTLLEEPLV